MKILYATDGSEQSGAALRLIESLDLTTKDSVRIVSVLTRPMMPSTTGLDLATAAWATMAEVFQEEQRLAENAVNSSASRLHSRNVATSSQVREGDAAREILAAADEWGADLVVLGACGLSGLERLLLGSVARNVAKHSQFPVLVAREPKAGLERVVLATDGSEHASHAAGFAARLPLPVSTQFLVAHVARPYAPFPGILPTDRPEFDAAVREVNRQRLAAGDELAGEAVSRLREAGRSAKGRVLAGDPAGELVALAREQQVDLIIAGARGVSLLEGLLTGSVADRLLKDAECSVLLVR